MGNKLTQKGGFIIEEVSLSVLRESAKNKHN